VAEIAIGYARTLFVTYAGTLAGTLYAWHGMHVGPGRLFGLPGVDALVRDSGPSAAVVALAVCAAWQYRAWLTGALVIGGMLLEAALLPNLAGVEHLVAILTAMVIAASAQIVDSRISRAAAAAEAARITRTTVRTCA
jgi:hypothetical protein